MKCHLRRFDLGATAWKAESNSPILPARSRQELASIAEICTSIIAATCRGIRPNAPCRYFLSARSDAGDRVGIGRSACRLCVVGSCRANPDLDRPRPTRLVGSRRRVVGRRPELGCVSTRRAISACLSTSREARTFGLAAWYFCHTLPQRPISPRTDLAVPIHRMCDCRLRQPREKRRRRRRGWGRGTTCTSGSFAAPALCRRAEIGGRISLFRCQHAL